MAEDQPFSVERPFTPTRPNRASTTKSLDDDVAGIMSHRSFQPFHHLERTLERVVEGPVSVLFRNSIQPANVYRSLERELIAESMPSHGRSIAPNEFTVFMHPDDLAIFDSIGGGLETHFEELLEESAADANIVFLGAVQVELVPDEGQRHRRVTIESTVSSQEPASAAETPIRHATESVGQPQPAYDLVTYGIVVGPHLSTGITHYFYKQRNSIGRALDNDIVIPAPQISRHHAIIEIVDGVARVIDLGSTNGTAINGVRIVDWSIIKHGDRLVLGTELVRVFRESPS